MSAEAKGETALTEQLRIGALDLCDLVLTPDRFPEWRSAAESIPLEALLVAEPDIGERNANRVLGTSQLGPGDTLGGLDDASRAWLAEMVLFWRRQMIEVSREISPKDGFHQKAPDGYFRVGQKAVRRIRMAMLEAGVRELTSILDFGCGYGRVLRALSASFPEAKLTACDINRDGVDFCAETFGATPVYSASESKDIPLEGPFDLIWAGSVFSHLSAVRWTDFLGSFEALLAPRGLLVFTAQGHRTATAFRRREFPWLTQDRWVEMVESLISGFREQGFSYQDYPGANWGLALAKPWWICAELDRHPELRLLGIREHGWGYQDVVSCMRADAEERERTGAHRAAAKQETP
jgi:SAM-dependent methyltransferase